MNHEFDLSAATMLPPMDGAPAGDQLAELAARWDAVHAAADAVAQLAQLGRETPAGSIASLPLRAAACGGWRSAEVITGIEDLAAVMHTGLRALIASADAGRDTTAAAVTLWREFHAARGAICAVVEPERLAA